MTLNLPVTICVLYHRITATEATATKHCALTESVTYVGHWSPWHDDDLQIFDAGTSSAIVPGVSVESQSHYSFMLPYLWQHDRQRPIVNYSDEILNNIVLPVIETHLLSSCDVCDVLAGFFALTPITILDAIGPIYSPGSRHIVRWFT